MSVIEASDCQASDYQALLCELRCREIGWLRHRRVELVREQRRLRVEEEAVLAVLDERGAAEPVAGESERTAREKLEVARRLEAVPEIADAALAGALSSEQLVPVVQLADETNQREWAVRAPNISPVDLRRLERRTRECTPADEAARHQARALHWWMREDAGMLSLRGEIPGVDGVMVKQVLDDMVEHMKPAKGERWDTRAHRGADALVQLVREHTEGRGSPDPVPPSRTRVIVHVDPDGHADVEGVAISQVTLGAMVEDSIVEAVFHVDGAPFAYGPGRITIPDRLRRAIFARDRHCRWPGCERTDCELHHLIPVSEGGETEPGNLVPACRGTTGHHRKLEPHGPFRLVGNPNRPDGLTLVDTRTGTVLAGEPLSRAGPAP